MKTSDKYVLLALAIGLTTGFMGGRVLPKIGGETPCEIVTKRAISPGMVIECPTGDTTQGCDTTYYYRLP